MVLVDLRGEKFHSGGETALFDQSLRLVSGLGIENLFPVLWTPYDMVRDGVIRPASIFYLFQPPFLWYDIIIQRKK